MGFNYDSDEYKQPLQYVLNQFLHGENIALRLAGKWVHKAPEAWQREYLALDQVPEEARHVKVFSRRIREIGGEPLAVCNGDKSLVSPALVDLCDVLLESGDWLDAITTMQIALEGLAMATFHTFMDTEDFDPKTREMLPLIMEEEYRHTLFGDKALKQWLEENPDRRDEVIPHIIKIFSAMTSNSRERWLEESVEENIESMMRLPRSFEAVGVNFTDVMGRFIADIACRLERAGYDWQEIDLPNLGKKIAGGSIDEEFEAKVAASPELQEKRERIHEGMQGMLSEDELVKKIPQFFMQNKKEFDPNLPATREAAGAGPCH